MTPQDIGVTTADTEEPAYFEGSLKTQYWSTSIVYSGYTQTAPYMGYIETKYGRQIIKVLDNTGGRFLIYDGKLTLRAPDLLGTFICDWN
jgi:hypothetical protein